MPFVDVMSESGPHLRLILDKAYTDIVRSKQLQFRLITNFTLCFLCRQKAVTP